MMRQQQQRRGEVEEVEGSRTHRQEGLHKVVEVFCHVILCRDLARSIGSLGESSPSMKGRVNEEKGRWRKISQDVRGC